MTADHPRSDARSAKIGPPATSPFRQSAQWCRLRFEGSSPATGSERMCLDSAHSVSGAGRRALRGSWRGRYRRGVRSAPPRVPRRSSSSRSRTTTTAAVRFHFHVRRPLLAKRSAADSPSRHSREHSAAAFLSRPRFDHEWRSRCIRATPAADRSRTSSACLRTSDDNPHEEPCQQSQRSRTL